MRREKRKGFTLIEMILVLAALVSFLGVVFAIYKTKIEPSRWSQSKFQTFQSVVAALENARSANGGAYPAAVGVDLSSTTPPGNAKAKLVWYAVTGGTPTSDIAGWSYSCSGSNLDITVSIADKPSAAAAGVFISSVENNIGMSVTSGSESSDTVTFRKTGVICN